MVQVKFKNELEYVEVEGDLLELVNSLNIAAANGKQFTVVQEHGGGPLAVDMRNINFMREADSERAFIS